MDNNDDTRSLDKTFQHQGDTTTSRRKEFDQPSTTSEYQSSSSNNRNNRLLLPGTGGGDNRTLRKTSALAALCPTTTNDVSNRQGTTSSSNNLGDAGGGGNVVKMQTTSVFLDPSESFAYGTRRGSGQSGLGRSKSFKCHRVKFGPSAVYDIAPSGPDDDVVGGGQEEDSDHRQPTNLRRPNQFVLNTQGKTLPMFITNYYIDTN